MLFSLIFIITFASIANAVPFYRYDNETTAGPGQPWSRVIMNSDNPVSTSPSNKHEHLPSSVASSGHEFTTVVTKYVTQTINGFTTTSPVSTYTTSLVDETTTSTITNFITITESNGSLSTEVVESQTTYNELFNACVCVPSTVTILATATVSISDSYSITTSTSMTSYPVIGEFTLGGATTTVTSFVDVLLTKTAFVPILSTSIPSLSSFNNASISSITKNKRAYFFEK